MKRHRLAFRRLGLDKARLGRPVSFAGLKAGELEAARPVIQVHLQSMRALWALKWPVESGACAAVAAGVPDIKSCSGRTKSIRVVNAIEHDIVNILTSSLCLII